MSSEENVCETNILSFFSNQYIVYSKDKKVCMATKL